MNKQAIRINGYGSNALLAWGLIFGASSTSLNVGPRATNWNAITEADEILRREFKLRPKQFVTMLKEVAGA